jgi:hypothetical protein
MDNYFIHSGIIAFVYLLLKFAEMRIVTKETKPLKDLMRDTLLVYVSCIVGLYVISELVPSAGAAQEVVTNVFVDKPGF